MTGSERVTEKQLAASRWNAPIHAAAIESLDSVACT